MTWRPDSFLVLFIRRGHSSVNTLNFQISLKVTLKFPTCSVIKTPFSHLFFNENTKMFRVFRPPKWPPCWVNPVAILGDIPFRSKPVSSKIGLESGIEPQIGLECYLCCLDRCYKISFSRVSLQIIQSEITQTLCSGHFDRYSDGLIIIFWPFSNLKTEYYAS